MVIITFVFKCLVRFTASQNPYLAELDSTRGIKSAAFVLVNLDVNYSFDVSPRLPVFLPRVPITSDSCTASATTKNGWQTPRSSGTCLDALHSTTWGNRA